MKIVWLLVLVTAILFASAACLTTDRDQIPRRRSFGQIRQREHGQRETAFNEIAQTIDIWRRPVHCRMPQSQPLIAAILVRQSSKTVWGFHTLLNVPDFKVPKAICTRDSHNQTQAILQPDGSVIAGNEGYRQLHGIPAMAAADLGIHILDGKAATIRRNVTRPALITVQAPPIQNHAPMVAGEHDRRNTSTALSVLRTFADSMNGGLPLNKSEAQS